MYDSEVLERLDKALYSSDGDEAMTVLNVVGARGRLQLSNMGSINVTKTALRILDLDDSDPKVYASVRNCIISFNVNNCPPYHL